MKKTAIILAVLLCCMIFMGAVRQKAPDKNENSGFGGSGTVALVLGALVVLRAFRVSRKYHKRYGKGYVYRLKSHTRPLRDEDGADFPSGSGGSGNFDDE